MTDTRDIALFARTLVLTCQYFGPGKREEAVDRATRLLSSFFQSQADAIERDEAIVRAAEQEDRAETAERQLADALEALTPSAETKAAYIGEFTIAVERIVNEDLEPEDESDAAPDPYEHIMVPWTTIKEIMAAIRARAMLSASPVPPSERGYEDGTGARVSVEYDGFAGTVIGSYRTREGKRGWVVQQDGTKVVHVYGQSRVTVVTPAIETLSNSGAGK